jgi:hypothetical protein
MRIAFGHKSRSGKDTCADYIIKRYGGTKLNIAAPVYAISFSIQQVLNLPVGQKEPPLLQYIGEGMRNIYGKDIWVRQLGPKIEHQGAGEHLIVADLRYSNEAEYLRAKGFTLVNIRRPNRPIDRDPSHISENDLNEYDFDFTIINDGTLGELYEEVEHLVADVNQ